MQRTDGIAARAARSAALAPARAASLVKGDN